MIKLMIFDHDMTIVDSNRAIMTVFNKVADRVGRPHVTCEQVMNYSAAAMPEFCEGMLGEYHPEWVDMYVEISAAVERDLIEPFPDLEPTVKALRKMGLSLAVASNRENPKDVMESSGTARFFDALVGHLAEHGRTRPYKPNPAMLIELMEKFNISRNQTAYVGDAVCDMETAINAGVRGIGIPRGHYTEQELLAAGAWRIIHSLEELPALAALNDGQGVLS